MSADEKLEFFTSAIYTDGNAEASRILTEIQAESERTLAAAEDEYLNEAYRHIRSEIGRIRTEMRRKVSQKLLENKRAQFLLQNRLFEDIRQAVLARVEAYTETEAYRRSLTESLIKIYEEFNHDAMQVYLRLEDMQWAPLLQAALPDAELSFFEGNFKLGGLLCQCEIRHWQVDDTFDTRYAELELRFTKLLGVTG